MDDSPTVESMPQHVGMGLVTLNPTPKMFARSKTVRIARVAGPVTATWRCEPATAE